MFEHKGTLYNPRMIRSIGEIKILPTGKARFGVEWNDGSIKPLTFENAEVAAEQRKLLAVHVDNCNGV